MKCPNCDCLMEMEDYDVSFRDNDEQVELIQHYWCPNCNKTLKYVILYTKEKEWEE